MFFSSPLCQGFPRNIHPWQEVLKLRYGLTPTLCWSCNKNSRLWSHFCYGKKPCRQVRLICPSPWHPLIGPHTSVEHFTALSTMYNLHRWVVTLYLTECRSLACSRHGGRGEADVPVPVFTGVMIWYVQTLLTVVSVARRTVGLLQWKMVFKSPNFNLKSKIL